MPSNKNSMYIPQTQAQTDTTKSNYGNYSNNKYTGSYTGGQIPGTFGQTGQNGYGQYNGSYGNYNTGANNSLNKQNNLSVTKSYNEEVKSYNNANIVNNRVKSQMNTNNPPGYNDYNNPNNHLNQPSLSQNYSVNGANTMGTGVTNPGASNYMKNTQYNNTVGGYSDGKEPSMTSSTIGNPLSTIPGMLTFFIIKIRYRLSKSATIWRVKFEW